MTPRPRTTNLGGDYNPSYNFNHTNDLSIVSWLAQYDPRELPPNLGNAFRLGPIQSSLGITQPIVWLANLSCNFKKAYNTVDDPHDVLGPTLGGRLNRENGKRTFPREFAREEQARFDKLQDEYHNSRWRNLLNLGYDPATAASMVGAISDARQNMFSPPPLFALSPRMIVTDEVKRESMRRVLIDYLDAKASEAERELLEDLEREESAAALETSVNGYDNKKPGKNAKKKAKKKKKRQQAKQQQQMEPHQTPPDHSQLPQMVQQPQKKEVNVNRLSEQQLKYLRDHHQQQQNQRTAYSEEDQKIIEDALQRNALLSSVATSMVSAKQIYVQASSVTKEAVDAYNKEGGREAAIERGSDVQTSKEAESHAYTWCCDYCKIATFPTFAEAALHESKCPVFLENKTKKGSGKNDVKPEWMDRASNEEYTCHTGEVTFDRGVYCLSEERKSLKISVSSLKSDGQGGRKEEKSPHPANEELVQLADAINLNWFENKKQIVNVPEVKEEDARPDKNIQWRKTASAVDEDGEEVRSEENQNCHDHEMVSWANQTSPNGGSASAADGERSDGKPQDKKNHERNNIGQSAQYSRVVDDKQTNATSRVDGMEKDGQCGNLGNNEQNDDADSDSNEKSESMKKVDASAANPLSLFCAAKSFSGTKDKAGTAKTLQDFECGRKIEPTPENVDGQKGWELSAALSENNSPSKTTMKKVGFPNKFAVNSIRFTSQNKTPTSKVKKVNATGQRSCYAKPRAFQNNLRGNIQSKGAVKTNQKKIDLQIALVNNVEKENEHASNDNGQIIFQDSVLSPSLLNKHAQNITTLPQSMLTTDVATEWPTGLDTTACLKRLSAVASENEILEARNNFLVQENKSLHAEIKALRNKLVVDKEKSIEAVQRVQLKAYIAESARDATEERLARLEYMLTNAVAEMRAKEMVQREVREASAIAAAYYSHNSLMPPIPQTSMSPLPQAMSPEYHFQQQHEHPSVLLSSAALSLSDVTTPVPGSVPLLAGMHDLYFLGCPPHSRSPTFYCSQNIHQGSSDSSDGLFPASQGSISNSDFWEPPWISCADHLGTSWEGVLSRLRRGDHA